MKVYYNEDQYIAMHGGGNLIGTGIVTQSHLSRNGEAIRELTRQLDIIEQSNDEARAQMARELEAGTIRLMTPVEQLMIQANGHPDNEATNAARRCLAKRGISL